MSLVSVAYPMLDLSGLAKLGQLFTALFQAFWPIFVILFVASILLALLGIGAKFGIGSIFKAGDIQKANARRSKIAFALFFALSLVILLMANANVQAVPMSAMADGTTGSLEIGVTNILDSTPITIRMYELTYSADFKLNWTGDDTGHSFTTGASQDEHFVTVNIAKPAASNDVTVKLCGGTGVALLDSMTLYVSDTSIFPDDIIIDIGIVLAVVFIIVAVVASLKRKG